MLEAIAILLCCQLLGELVVAGLNLPLPGPVIGMAILFFGLYIHGRVPDDLASVTQGLLGQLSLLFIPAGVGVMTHLNLLGAQWIPLSISLIASLIVAFAVTGWLMQWLIDTVPGNDDSNEEQKHE